MSWIETSAPSNIALIKYMGKVSSTDNRPTNASLSWTLENLRTYVRIQKIESADSISKDVWSAYTRSDLQPISLSETGRAKFLNFFELLKKEFKLSGHYQIESANNFPSDCGLASSASSFAALTKCAHDVYLAESNVNSELKARPYTNKELSKLTQKGSGSSCRSFFSPWALWHDSGAEEIQLPIKKLKHMVIMCDESIKSVSSSDAHKLVLTSEHFKGRPERATERLQRLNNALRNQQWSEIYHICWNEFWDMHNLFHTAVPPLMYINGQAMNVLNELNQYWKINNDGPLITMDAGSNIHLLFREDQNRIHTEIFTRFIAEHNIFSELGFSSKSGRQ